MTDAGWDYGQLDRIAVTVGPGGFTGVRIGLAAARGIGLAAGKPVAGVSTLAALAAGIPTPQGSAILVAIDSKRGDVYAQAFASAGDGVEPCAAPMAAPWVAAASDVWTALPDGRRPWVVVGDASEAVAAALQRRGILAEASAPEQPDAAVVASLAARMTLQLGAPPPRPIYLRPPDVSAPAADGSAALLGSR